MLILVSAFMSRGYALDCGAGTQLLLGDILGIVAGMRHMHGGWEGERGHEAEPVSARGGPIFHCESERCISGTCALLVCFNWRYRQP